MENQADQGNEKELRDLNAKATELMMALARAEGRIEGVTQVVDLLQEWMQVVDLGQSVRSMGEEVMRLSFDLLDLSRKHTADLSSDSMRMLDILMVHHKATHD